MKFRKILLVVLVTCLFVTGCSLKKSQESNVKKEEKKEEPKVVKKLKIYDEESNTRPYAIMINNHPKAMKVQAALNDAYMVYEFPIEGGYSRSMAVFKDKTNEIVGTVRSARQYHPYFAIENDAIYVHWGQNHPAKDVIRELKMDDINAETSGKPFFRKNPEKLATEHTGYTSLVKLNDYAKSKNMRMTTDVKPPLKYSYDEIDLSKSEDAMKANTINLPYSNSYKLKYVYDSETNRYTRYYNDKLHQDYYSKENFTTKNIIIEFVSVGKVKEYADAAGTNYLDMTVTGSGEGYYITNGYARKITWTKSSKNAKTEFKYSDGTEVNVNDGNTYVNFFDKSKSVNISE